MPSGMVHVPRETVSVWADTHGKRKGVEYMSEEKDYALEEGGPIADGTELGMDESEGMSGWKEDLLPSHAGHEFLSR